MGTEDRKERERQARRAEILRAAEALFSERGFHEVSMDAIAERAELSKGAVYLYFCSKEELFFTLIRETAQNFLAALESAIEEAGSFVDRLTNVVRRYFAFFEEHRAFFKLIHSEKSRMDALVADEFRREMANLFGSFIAFYERVMETGKREGVLRDVPALHLVHCLNGMLDSFVFHWVYAGPETGLVEMSEAVLDLFLHGGGKQKR
ncbi:MAG: TetR/AcrR family transcriptional regulator [bacterium]|nr:TetR/AcrR family transcriptional regulator [candidate division KSB1 bacterium]MDH7561401.1 TetR/AcrR family transcriptional regulator [bacterium]